MSSSFPTASELNLMQGSPPSADKRVTLQNWYIGAPVRWSFQHIEQLLPCARAHRGRGPVSELVASAEAADVAALPFLSDAGTQMTVGQLLAQTCTDGLLVLKSGQVVYEQYIDMHDYQRHLLQSVSKSLTACLLAVFVDKGVIDVNQTVAHYLPEFANSAYADAIIQHVLDMSASVHYDETYDDMLSDVNLHTIAGGWYGHVERTGPHINIPFSLYEYLPTLTRRDSWAHGDVFKYVSANTDVLGILIERVGRAPFTQLFQEHIWQHLGAEEDAVMTVDPWGCAFPCGGFAVTLRDLGRFGQLCLNSGFYNGKQIVPATFFDDTHRNGSNTAWQRSESNFSILPNGSYRNQFWNTGNAHGAFFGVGIHGQYVYIDPAADVVIIKLSSYPDALYEPNDYNTILAFDAIAKTLM